MEITRHHTATYLQHQCGKFTCRASYQAGKLSSWCAFDTADGAGAGKEILRNVLHCPGCGQQFPTGIAVKVEHLVSGSGLHSENWSRIEEQAEPKTQ